MREVLSRQQVAKKTRRTKTIHSIERRSFEYLQILFETVLKILSLAKYKECADYWNLNSSCSCLILFNLLHLKILRLLCLLILYGEL